MMSPHGGGYADGAYARTLHAYGQPLFLPRSMGWLLRRPIPGTPFHDAMGCYPLFSCEDWGGIQEDLEELEGSLVSVVLVTDPFAPCRGESLSRSFPDRMIEFKQHRVTALPCGPTEALPSHHARNVRQALTKIEVATADNPSTFLGAWCGLYDVLVARHGIRGMLAFGRDAFAQQLQLPDLRAHMATLDGEIVGMTLWIIRGQTAYYHLGAYSDAGYSSRASYALFAYAREAFSQAGLAWLDLGAAAGDGKSSGSTDGLTRFKDGWATGRRPVYLCGRILDPDAYAELAAAAPSTTYFPAYRSGEFTSPSDADSASRM